VVKTRGSIKAALPGFRQAVHDVDPEADVLNAQTMDELIAPQLAEPRFDALPALGVCIGGTYTRRHRLYGIMASAVAQQTRELGVRMALGATPDHLRRMVLARHSRSPASGRGGTRGRAGVCTPAYRHAVRCEPDGPRDPGGGFTPVADGRPARRVLCPPGERRRSIRRER